MPSKGHLAVLGERWVEIRILVARRYSVRLGSDSTPVLSFTPEPARHPFAKRKRGIRILAARRRSVRLGSDSHPRLSFTTEPVRIPCAKRKRALSALFSFWPALGDSNPQPSESESDTLSNCAKGRYEIPCGIYLFSESFIRFSAFL